MTTATKLSLKKVGYNILYVKDTEKALAFYRDRLGVPVRSAEQGWVELATEGFTLALHGCDKVHKQPETAPTLVFNVDDIRAAHEALKAEGVKVSELHQVCEHDGKVGMSGDFTDLDGNRLSVFGWAPKGR